jgi:outer membrane receptor for ferrienterochelin and colicins
LFTQADFKTETGLETLVGARYTNHSQFGAYLSPKISLMYRLDDFRFRGSISNGFKAPTLKEMYMNFPHRIGEDIPFYVIGNADLVPEESWYKSLSAEYIGNKINASLTVHQNAIKNKINTIQQWNEAQNRTEMLYENVEDAEITGIDLSFQWAFLKHFHLRGGYSYADAIDKDTRLQLYGNSKHTGTMSLIFKQRHLPLFSSLETPYTLSLSGRVMSPRIFSTKNEETGIITDESTGNYFISNFVYSQQFPIYNKWKGDLQFGINNLLNYTNRDFLSNNPGRLYFVSVGVKF